MNLDLNNAIILLLGVAPSIVWLIFYLKEDPHPEPRLWILLTFLAGASVVPVVFLVERTLIKTFAAAFGISLEALMVDITFMFLGVAFIEEIAKFIAVKIALARNKTFDEAIDAMIYMITAALGFAALENIVLLRGLGGASYGDVIQTIILRLIGANFLHTLSSGILGFLWAVSFFARTDRAKYMLICAGIASATILHGFFNILILKLGVAYLFPATFLLFAMGLVILHDFDILKTLRTPINNIRNAKDE